MMMTKTPKRRVTIDSCAVGTRERRSVALRPVFDRFDRWCVLLRTASCFSTIDLQQEQQRLCADLRNRVGARFSPRGGRPHTGSAQLGKEVPLGTGLEP